MRIKPIRPPSPSRILIVEDELVVAMDMEMQLQAVGYEVTGIATTGDEAQHLAQTTRPDLVLMDIQLRGPMDGFATATEMQRLGKMPVVFLTAFGNEDAQRRALEIGSYGYLTKPYRPEALTAVVSAALEQRGIEIREPRK
jgi:DNA-binding response OmpR family regulator